MTLFEVWFARGSSATDLKSESRIRDETSSFVFNTFTDSGRCFNALTHAFHTGRFREWSDTFLAGRCIALCLCELPAVCGE